MRRWEFNEVPCKRSAILTQLGDRFRGQPVSANLCLFDENRHIPAVPEAQVRVGVDVDFFELHAEGAELGGHLVAEMAALAAVELSPCQ